MVRPNAHRRRIAISRRRRAVPSALAEVSCIVADRRRCRSDTAGCANRRGRRAAGHLAGGRHCPRWARSQCCRRQREARPDAEAAARDPDARAGATSGTDCPAPRAERPAVTAAPEVASTAPRALGRRLLPLQIAVGLSGVVFWVPVEKLFMTQIGFTPRSVAVMAAAYAAVVPLLEVPSGILADRWSRNRIMGCAGIALFASTLLGGLSRNVPTYIGAAMMLGVYFALSSGTVDSIVYDVVLEETGSSDQYEAWIGRTPDRRERRLRPERARRWRARWLVVCSVHLLRDAAVRGDRRRRLLALRRATSAPRGGTGCVASPRCLDVPNDPHRADTAARRAAGGARRAAVSSRIRIRTVMARRAGRPGRTLRPLLGGSRRHPRRRRLPDRKTEPRAAHDRRVARSHCACSGVLAHPDRLPDCRGRGAGRPGAPPSDHEHPRRQAAARRRAVPGAGRRFFRSRHAVLGAVLAVLAAVRMVRAQP